MRHAVLAGGGVGEAVDQQRQAGRAGDDAGDVETLPQAAPPQPTGPARAIGASAMTSAPIGTFTKSTQRHDT